MPDCEGPAIRAEGSIERAPGAKAIWRPGAVPRIRRRAASRVLWLPDLWILAHGEPIHGVGVLMRMHLGIAFVTYPALVRPAPEGPLVAASRSSAQGA
jgi:hypothetical protein